MPERIMTKEDWKALYWLHQLAEQVCLHGADHVWKQIRQARKAVAHETP